MKDLTLDLFDPIWYESDLDDKHVLFQLPTHFYQLGSLLESLKLYSCGFDMPIFLKFSALKNVSLGLRLKFRSILPIYLSRCKTIESSSLTRC